MITCAEFEVKVANERKEIKDLEKLIKESEMRINKAKHLKYKANLMIERSEMLNLTGDELKLAEKIVDILHFTLESLEAQHSLEMKYLSEHQKTSEELREVGWLMNGGVDGLFEESVKLVRS